MTELFCSFLTNILFLSLADYCSPNPCKNKGVCVVEEGKGYSCSCHPGFTGFHCQGRKSRIPVYRDSTNGRKFTAINHRTSGCLASNAGLTGYKFKGSVQFTKREQKVSCLGYATLSNVSASTFGALRKTCQIFSSQSILIQLDTSLTMVRFVEFCSAGRTRNGSAWKCTRSSNSAPISARPKISTSVFFRPRAHYKFLNFNFPSIAHIPDQRTCFFSLMKSQARNVWKPCLKHGTFSAIKYKKR